jgi:hypothetical protein
MLRIQVARKLDNTSSMEQHCKWIVYGSDGLGVGGKGSTRMRPRAEVASARSWARFPNHCQWLHGIIQVRNLEGRAVPHRSIRA